MLCPGCGVQTWLLWSGCNLQVTPGFWALKDGVLLLPRGLLDLGAPQLRASVGSGGTAELKTWKELEVGFDSRPACINEVLLSSSAPWASSPGSTVFSGFLGALWSEAHLLLMAGSPLPSNSLPMSSSYLPGSLPWIWHREFMAVHTLWFLHF